MKKSIFLFFAAILCAMTANAYNQSAKDLYFDNSEAKWNSCYVYIGHGTWTSVYPLTRVSGTQYLWKLSSNFNGGNSWNGATGWVLCYEKWWDSKGESIDKYTWHGDKNVTQKSISAWVDTKIYKTNGTASTKSDNHTINAYKVTSYTKSNYTVTINTATGGTLTVKDYDNNAVATGASKIHLTVLKFSATPADGYVLDGVEINDGTNTTTIAAADLATKTHTLTSAVTITPVWRATTSTVTVTATATNGTVTGGGVVEKGASVTLTATAADGYKFANWTVGGAEVSTANPYTFTAEEDVTVVANFEELPKETVYFVNNKNWTKVQAYVWNEGGNNGWPGQAMTATGEQVAGFDVYSYTAIEGNANVIFNDGSAQTADYVWTNGNYYYMGAAANYAGGTKEEVAKAANPDPLATEVYLAGDMNGWNQSSTAFRKATAEGTTASVSVELNKETYAFKIIDNGTWLGNNGTMTREYHEGWIFRNKQDDGVTDEGDAHITADFAGTYTFTWDMTNKKLTVTFPELPKYTVTTSATEGGSVTEGGEFTQGTEVALTATPAEGYHFEKWSNESTENPLTITVTEDVELQAIFAINVYDVTATAENGTVTGAGIYNHGEEVTLTATANDHYVFVNWTKGEEVVSTENPYTFNVTDDVDLVANFKLDSHTVTATAENGTVTGAGTYNHGEEVTLTATPAFDYQFVNWSNGSTENPLTITVTDNETLEAIFAEVAATEKKESGVFSISAHKTATFATGNLQHNVGTGEWRFAKQQYQVVGEQNIQLGHPDFTGWIDMLGYSADGKYGVNPSNANADYAEEFVDWGTLFPEEGWSTLSKEDWKYLLEERTNAATLQQVAKVGDILGIMLFPDNWTLPEDCNPTPEINHDPDDGEETKYDFTTQNYTLEQWTKLEQAGAVFLPAAGRRTGGWGNTTLSENVPGGVLDADGHYKHFDNCNEYAYYWTSTKVGENVNYLINCRLVDKPNDIYSVGAAHVDWAEKGRYGQSVRLAKVAYDKHTVTATAENGTVTGDGEYTHGTEITLTAIPAEHYVFVNWTAGETVLSTENPYIFTLEADVELKANFALDTHTVAAAAENGTVTGDGEYTHGTKVTLTATPAEGYEFVNWTVGEEVVAETAEYTFTVEADVNLVANFQEVVPVITHTVTWYTAVGETTEDTLEEGDTITKPATDPEKEGYVFMGWTNECFVAEDGSDFTAIEDFGTADADKEYYAVFAKEMTTGGAANKTYSFDITKADFNATSYAANNTTKTSKATASDGSTLDVQWTSNQVMLQSSAIQFKKNEGYIYNNTDLKNIISVEVTSTAGTFTTYYGTSSQPSNNTSVGSENGYFKIKVGSATGKCSNIKITFAHVISGEPTTTYSNYMTTCTPEEYTIVWSVNGVETDTTTVVEGDALVLPEAPAAPDACSEKVFMGWATTATVNADGSAITWVDETFVPESDSTYYAVFATEIKEETNETYTKTATVNIADYATANSWADATKYENVIIDQNITATAISTGSNTGKYYANGNNWRLYQTEEDATLTIGAAEGVTIDSVIVTYTTNSNGVLTFNTSKITSGTTVEVNAPSVTFGVGNTGTATNGQVRVTKIAVDYTFSGTLTSTTYTDYSTICVIPEYTVTFDYSVDAGYIIVNDKRISEKEVKYVEGTELTVKALTFNNYRFDAWMDEEENELSTEPTYTFTVTKDVVLKAIITYEQGAVGTSVENNNVVMSETIKVIQNGRLFIIRKGKIYNAQGQVVK